MQSDNDEMHLTPAPDKGFSLPAGCFLLNLGDT
jgi:hypothetical protein